MKRMLILVFALTATAGAQTKGPLPKLTGILSNDLFSQVSQPGSSDSAKSFDEVETRSAIKAGFFSLIIPGAGQIYNGGTGNYLKAAGFLALEAAGIAVNILWTKKGNNQTTFFQNYADANYSPLRYAQWIKLNLNTWDPNAATDGTQNLVDNKLFINGGPQPWQKVDFTILNRIETTLGQTSAGEFFSHVLAAHGTQDYYEVIGKYAQFREGWNPNAATDNVNVTYDQLNNDVQANTDYYYMSERAKGNNYFAVAGTALGVVIANHFASAIEAALWAHAHEKRIETSINLSPLPEGLGYQTEFRVAFHF